MRGLVDEISRNRITLSISVIVCIIYFSIVYMNGNTRISDVHTDGYDDFNYRIELLNRIKIIEKNSKKEPYLTIGKESLLCDVRMYKGISEASKDMIVGSVIKYSEEYGLNPLIVYSVLHTESSMRFWIRHSSVNIKIDDKKIQTRAIGLGGIVWEWWKCDLIDSEIALVKSDLFKIKNNIHATCYVLNVMKSRKILSGSKDNTDSMLRRYFGGNYESYSEKVYSKVAQIAKNNMREFSKKEEQKALEDMILSGKKVVKQSINITKTKEDK